MNNININGHEWDYTVNFLTVLMGGTTSSSIVPLDDPSSSPKRVIARPKNVKVAAESLARDLMKVAEQANISVLEIVKNMQGQDGVKLNASLSYYLNGIRNNTSLLGVQNVSKPNFYASRMILI